MTREFTPTEFIAITFVLYLFVVWVIRSKLSKLHNLENVTKCMRLPKKIQLFLFLPIPFKNVYRFFPVHTVVLTSLFHLGCLSILTIGVAQQFLSITLPDWYSTVIGTSGVLMLSFLVEILWLSSDENSQQPPKGLK